MNDPRLKLEMQDGDIVISLEERGRMRQEENEDLLKRIEKTHRGPTSE